MDRQVVWTIFGKEMLDLLRDRKTLIGTFLIPLVVIPFVFFLLSMSYSNVEKEARAYVPIAVTGTSKLVDHLRSQPGVRILSPDRPAEALQAGELRAIVTIPDHFDQALRSGGSARLHVAYDNTNQKSVYAKSVIDSAVQQYSSDIVSMRLRQAGLSAEAIKPIETTYENAASDERQTGGMLAGIIPLMVVLSLASGGVAAATDLVAGEKERGTLESLLTTPIAANQILTAKLLAVMVMSCISATASLLSLSFVFRLGPLKVDGTVLSFGFLSPASLAVLAATIVLLAALFAGLELTLSTVAKSFKEGQTYMTGVVILAMIPSYMLMPIHPVDIPGLYYVLPVFNGVALCKEAFYGAVDPLHTLVGLGTSLLYVSVVIAATARLFRREGAVVRW
ncbi:ABC transporter permease [Brevibacillus thermoruber]|jgi:sodium transport system permease protein|uniref:ABC transporter permease n=1 Tax=Brevibacillus thermoruber TaxID=33942 RepID=A0A9X3TS70_9BACL|nr:MULTISPECIES: ABC transporter permease [Brevibacillus]MDA5109882.1 ABC transporter permease [Brevibacillus thermoruber]TRY24056.1 ABC transporter permease [Brevibacillus sp. LEMMJ03]